MSRPALSSAGLAGGVGGRRDRAVGVADPPAHRDEAVVCRGRVAARDRQPVDVALVARLQRAHAEAYGRRVGWVRLLPGAHQLRQHLSSLQVPWAVPPAGCRRRRSPPWTYSRSLPADVPVVTRDQVAMPSPTRTCSWLPLSGSTWTSPTRWWSATRCGTCWPRGERGVGVGLLSGGYGREELERAGADRVSDAPAGLLAHLDEVECAPRLRRPADRGNEPWPGTGRAEAHQAPSTGIS